MAAIGIDENDVRRAVVRGWLFTHLGRNSISGDELNLHTWVLATEGADKCLSNILDSPEAQAFRQKRGW